MKCRINLKSDPISLDIIAATGIEHIELEEKGNEKLIEVYLAKNNDEAYNKALEDSCGIIFGQCESDNIAQRTADEVRKLKK